MNVCDVERSLQTAHEEPFTDMAFPTLAQMVLGLVIQVALFCSEVFVARCAHIFHGVHYDMSVACCEVSPMSLDVHVL